MINTDFSGKVTFTMTKNTLFGELAEFVRTCEMLNVPDDTKICDYSRDMVITVPVETMPILGNVQESKRSKRMAKLKRAELRKQRRQYWWKQNKGNVGTVAVALFIASLFFFPIVMAAILN